MNALNNSINPFTFEIMHTNEMKLTFGVREKKDKQTNIYFKLCRYLWKSFSVELRLVIQCMRYVYYRILKIQVLIINKLCCCFFCHISELVIIEMAPFSGYM